MAEDFLGFAMALVEKLQRALFGMWENWQESMNFLVVNVERSLVKSDGAHVFVSFMSG
jgi:hypothetical protein